VIDWHTGELVSPGRASPTRRVDLDSSTGSSPLCAPLRLTRDPEWIPPSDGARFEPIIFRRPWALQVGAGRWLRLERCGHSGPVRRLVRCPFGPLGCPSALNRDFAAWVDNAAHRLWVLRLKTQKERAWRLPSTGLASAIALTRTHVYAAANASGTFAGTLPL
jgi:hypothetical protein